MVIVFALLAALANAVNEATQHIASTAAPRRSSGWRLVVYLFRNPPWLFGEHFTASAAALALAAAAFAVMCGGVVVLTQTAPATMETDIPDDQEGRQHDTASSRSQPRQDPLARSARRATEEPPS